VPCKPTYSSSSCEEYQPIPLELRSDQGLPGTPDMGKMHRSGFSTDTTHLRSYFPVPQSWWNMPITHAVVDSTNKEIIAQANQTKTKGSILKNN
jgi:hypothetical protein